MAMAPRFELRQGQTQSLVMTPQLQQAIKLLQMSNLELTEYVEAELERNPLLERSEGFVEKRASDTVESDRQDPKPASGDGDTDAPDLASSLSSDAHPQAAVEQLDTGLENVYADESKADAATRQSEAPDSGWSSVGQGSSAPLGEDYNFEATDLEELLTGRVIIGSPEECAEEIVRLSRSTDFTRLVARVQWLGMDQRIVLRTIEMLANEVRPLVERELG